MAIEIRGYPELILCKYQSYFSYKQRKSFGEVKTSYICINIIYKIT